MSQLYIGDGDTIKKLQMGGGMPDAFDRTKEEFDGWQMYKKMARETSSSEKAAAYKEASSQEYGHLMIAIADVIDLISADLEPHERQHYLNMLSALRSTASA